MAKHRNEALYFAYGANLNLDCMSRRCPTAVPLRTGTISGFKLVFRGACDIERCVGSVVHGGIYRVSPLDVLALDRYEGVAIGLYRQIILDDQDGLFGYIMDSAEPSMLPDAAYLDTVRQGYIDWNLPEDQVDAALSVASHVDQRWEVYHTV